MIVFQCFLFMWYAGMTAVYDSRSSRGFSGSHFTLNCRGWSLRLMSRKILPLTLNTSVDSPKGKDSFTDFFSRQYLRMISGSNLERFIFIDYNPDTNMRLSLVFFLLALSTFSKAQSAAKIHFDGILVDTHNDFLSK